MRQVPPVEPVEVILKQTPPTVLLEVRTRIVNAARGRGRPRPLTGFLHGDPGDPVATRLRAFP